VLSIDSHKLKSPPHK